MLSEAVSNTGRTVASGHGAPVPGGHSSKAGSAPSTGTTLQTCCVQSDEGA